jgi:hypothetical protein
VKCFLASLTLVIVIAALSSTAALASPPNLTGKWTIEQSGLNGTTSGVVTLTQTGNTLVGSNATNGNGFTGTFVSDSKLNGTWKGPGGAGWITVIASPNGHSFNGTWGYNGKKPNGTFVGNKIEPPAPITAAGNWNVTGIGSNQNFAGLMSCTQSGPTVVCQIKGATINGKYRTKDKVRATWRGPNGVGWFSYWFNDDSQSFNGQWGYGPDTTGAVGRVVGQRAASTH